MRMLELQPRDFSAGRPGPSYPTASRCLLSTTGSLPTARTSRLRSLSRRDAPAPMTLKLVIAVLFRIASASDGTSREPSKKKEQVRTAPSEVSLWKKMMVQNSCKIHVFWNISAKIQAKLAITLLGQTLFMGLTVQMNDLSTFYSLNFTTISVGQASFKTRHFHSFYFWTLKKKYPQNGRVSI